MPEITVLAIIGIVLHTDTELFWQALQVLNVVSEGVPYGIYAISEDG